VLLSRFPVRIVSAATAPQQIPLQECVNIPDDVEHLGTREVFEVQVLESFDGLETHQTDRWALAAQLPPQSLFRLRHQHVAKSAKAFYKDGQQPACWKIDKGQNALLQLSLNKTVYQLGELLHGTFEFEHKAASRCHQVSVWLETVESVPEALRNSIKGKAPFRKQYCEHHELTLHALQTHFTFQLPVEATQEFSTAVISLQWMLRFEFLTTDPKQPTNVLEPLKWELTLRVAVPHHPPELQYSPQYLFLA